MNKNQMIEKINAAKEAYYGNGRIIMTDAEYDKLVAEAEKLGYIETVGSAPVDAIEQIKHEHLMLSLEKCHKVNEIKKFMGKHECLFMYKADGLTCSATYIDGVLTRLETRGNGEVGNNIMFHRNSIINLPKRIDRTGKYVVDGECVILWSDFEKLNEKIVESERYSHPRNLAAGSLNQLDPAISKQRLLRFYAWDVIEGGSTNSLGKNLNEAENLGFDIVNYYNIDPKDGSYNFDAILDIMKRSAEIDNFPIDGIVIKYDDINYGKSLGRTSHHFKAGIAYKYQDDTYETKLKDVIWQVGKSGQITPVAIVEPVDVNGVIVEKASLHNISIMKQLGLTNGCTCYIKRANDVIPQIDAVEQDGDGEIEIPSTCPDCGSPTRIVKQNDSEVLMCTNDDCRGRVIGRWETFVSKKAMDIDGLSTATIERFYKLGYLTNLFGSIYELHNYKKELYKLDGFGKKSIDNLLASIEKSKNTDMQHLITSLSIPGIGENQAKLLSKYFNTMGEFLDAGLSSYRFDKIPGIGDILNANIHKCIVNNSFQIIDLMKYITIKQQETNQVSQVLKGKTFVVTGTVNHFKNRDELKEKIESLGGKVAGSVSKNTSFLINNDVTSTSGKNKKAQELGVKIISEEDFMRLIE